jgi:hypothetical protein
MADHLKQKLYTNSVTYLEFKEESFSLSSNPSSNYSKASNQKEDNLNFKTLLDIPFKEIKVLLIFSSFKYQFSFDKKFHASALGLRVCYKMFCSLPSVSSILPPKFPDKPLYVFPISPSELHANVHFSLLDFTTIILGYLTNHEDSLSIEFSIILNRESLQI